MTAVIASGRSAARAAERALAAARADLTEGQRWTAALALVLAALLLFAGLPTAITHIPGVARPTPVAAGEGGGSEVGPSDAPPDRPPVDVPVSVPDGGDDRPLVLPGDSVAAPSFPSGSAGLPTTADPPAVVALVREGDGPAGRDDAAMAAAFLSRAAFEAEIVPISGSVEETCAAALGRGTIVVVSTAVPASLERCLVDGGASVLAFGRSTTGPASGVVSTRRDLVASLVDLGRWGVAEGVLDGRVGIVAGEAEQARVETAAERIRRLGVDVAEVVLVGSDDPGSVTDGLRTFAAEGVEVAILAAPMTVQRQWAAQQVVLLPGLRTVVSDAFDAIVDESYPPSFDGALAHTSLRVPWFARAEGETVSQARCRQTWEEAAQTMLASETVRAFAWCQHLSMVGEVLRTATGDVGAGLRSLTVDSPLTSTLGMLPGGEFGPVADAALVWRASCGCWEPVDGFERR